MREEKRETREKGEKKNWAKMTTFVHLEKSIFFLKCEFHSPPFSSVWKFENFFVFWPNRRFFGCFQAHSKKFVFFNLKRFFKTVSFIVLLGISCVHSGINNTAAASLSGLVLGSKNPSPQISKMLDDFFLDNP